MSVRLSPVLALLASLTLELALHDSSDSRLRLLGVVGVQAGCIACGLRYFGRRESRSVHSNRRLVLPVSGLVFLPLGYEVLLRTLGESGRPVEVLLICALRDVTLGLAVVSRWPAYERLCGALSLFVLLFATSLSSHPATYAAVMLFAVVGVWWLMGNHWETLQDRIDGGTRSALPRPWLMLSAGLSLLLVGISAGENRVASALQGFMPSSGGTRWYDPDARGGVDDGDALVPGAQDAHTFGPVESQIFKESQATSLYDAIDEAYGEPYFPTEIQRAVSLPAQLVLEIERRMSQTKQAGREFSTLRRRTSAQRPVEGIDSEALFYVAGRTPLHLKMEVFDVFDGCRWYPEPASDSALQLEMEHVGEKQWLRIRSRRPSAVLRGNLSYAVRVISLASNRIPAPPHLLGAHIDRVADPRFFKFEQDGILALDRDTIPPLTVIHLQSQFADLENSDELWVPRVGRGCYSDVPTDFHTRQIASLAAEWVRGVPAGWSQVQTIVNRLRETYRHDRGAAPPDQCLHPTAWFLFESRSGTDYHFATAATLMLRSLGYQTRLVGGFYAHPQDYDQRARQTPVAAGDVHVWPEVQVDAGLWLYIEPTPGYELLGPPPGWFERLTQALVMLLELAYEYRVWLAALLVATLLTAVYRKPLIDCGATLGWRMLPVASPRRQILKALRLLEIRCRCAGLTRPPGTPAAAWFRVLAHGEGRAQMELLLSWADWAAFAPASQTLDTAQRAVVAKLVRETVQIWSLPRMRRALERAGSLERRRALRRRLLIAVRGCCVRARHSARLLEVIITRGGRT